MEKRIQIPVQLYEQMVSYIRNHYDPLDSSTYTAIQQGIEKKRDAEFRRIIYSSYKTADNPDTREMLRQLYLENSGVTGIWSAEVERQIKDGHFPL